MKIKTFAIYFTMKDTIECQICQNSFPEDSPLFVNTESKKIYCEACFLKEATEEDQNLTLITDREIDIWVGGNFSDHTKGYLKDILLGNYDLQEAKEDVLSFKKFKKY